MIKVMVLLRRPPSWTRERFQRWWLDEHVAYGKKLPNLRKYRLCLVTGSTSHEGREPWDGTAELWFDDRAALDRRSPCTCTWSRTRRSYRRAGIR